MNPHHRRLIVLRGAPEATAAEAESLIAGLDPADVLWVSESPRPAERGSTCAPTKVQRLLGRAFDAVVLDMHQALRPDVLGQSQGFVWGGGALILRLPPEDAPPLGGRASLAAFPHTLDEVTHRFWRHLQRALARAHAAPPEPLQPAPRAVAGTDDQARAVRSLTRLFTAASPGHATLVADRGRGKSSALGLALRDALASRPALDVVIVAGQARSAVEVFRFALGDETAPTSGPVRYRTPVDLLFGDEDPALVIVDEAAQIPVPILQRLVLRFRGATFAFATTARGYEGTGRGFLLRFVDWLADHPGDPRPLQRLTLDAPIRWAPDDPLETFVFDALLLDAEPAAADPSDAAPITHAQLDRDALVADERLLRDYFGLLVHAHYRTTPSDLQRILDAPNLDLHVLQRAGRVVAATMVAHEGALPDPLTDDVYWGRTRLRGHALPETLISHLGHTDAGPLRMVRSVRIAVHPDLRRQGLGTRLIEEVHASYDPDLFGTLFGVTPQLLAFRRQAGYRLVRISASRGTRTGEPAAVMIRPVTDRAQALVARLRAELARDLPLQLELLQVGHELVLDPALEAALQADLPAPSPLTPEDLDATLRAYAYGPRTYESAASFLTRFVQNHPALLDTLSPQERTLIERRVLERRHWEAVAEAAAYPSVRLAMRAMRRAFRAMLERVIEPDA